MRHKKGTRKMRGGDYLPKSVQKMLGYTVDEAVVAAPATAEQAVGEVVQPLGGTPESTGVPGGMSPEAPVNQVLTGGRRRRRKTKRSRKSRR
jgi:hypothetical protein